MTGDAKTCILLPTDFHLYDLHSHELGIHNPVINNSRREYIISELLVIDYKPIYLNNFSRSTIERIPP